MLEQLLAALGGIFAKAGVGEVVAGLVGQVLPTQFPFVAVLAYWLAARATPSRYIRRSPANTATCWPKRRDTRSPRSPMMFILKLHLQLAHDRIAAARR